MKTLVILLVFLGTAEWAGAQHGAAFQTWAATPPMGWNSYDAYYGTVTEKQFLKEVDVMAEKLLPVGYE
ncbi:MAG: hypothetical protein KGO92_12060, partial [Bacteroidota bacterium]|nr:hypothetical protein [Bacteroidota bacterium]